MHLRVPCVLVSFDAMKTQLPSVSASTASAGVSDAWSPELCDNTLMLCKPRNLWTFVNTALGAYVPSYKIAVRIK